MELNDKINNLLVEKILEGYTQVDHNGYQQYYEGLIATKIRNLLDRDDNFTKHLTEIFHQYLEKDSFKEIVCRVLDKKDYSNKSYIDKISESLSKLLLDEFLKKGFLELLENKKIEVIISDNLIKEI